MDMKNPSLENALLIEKEDLNPFLCWKKSTGGGLVNTIL